MQRIRNHIAANRDNRQSGFILVATLLLLSIIMLAAAYFATQADELRTHAIRMERSAQIERDAFNVTETLMYAAAVGTREEAGLRHAGEALATDGRQLAVSATTTASVQDERGLIAINIFDEAMLTRLLTAAGVPANQIAGFTDTLQDYIDHDDFKRLNGAESKEYKMLGLSAPANNYLRTREELTNIPGWDRLLSDLDFADEAGGRQTRARFLDLFSTARHFGINVNSAPPLVLALIPGMDPSRIGALIDQRQQRPFQRATDLAPFLTSATDSEFVGYLGANDLRLSIRKEDVPFLIECGIHISPGDQERPARTTYCARRAQPPGKDLTIDELRAANAYMPRAAIASNAPATNFNNDARKYEAAHKRPAAANAPSWLAIGDR